MKRRYNKNNLKRKKRTKMRSKIRSKVYKRTKKKHLSKKNKRQKGGSTRAHWYMNYQPIGSVWETGMPVLLKIGDKNKKCRILKIESSGGNRYLKFYVDKGDGKHEERVQEHKEITVDDAKSASIDGSSSVKISDYVITPVFSCSRREKGFFGLRRWGDDTVNTPAGGTEYQMSLLESIKGPRGVREGGATPDSSSD